MTDHESHDPADVVTGHMPSVRKLAGKMLHTEPPEAEPTLEERVSELEAHVHCHHVLEDRVTALEQTPDADKPCETEAPTDDTGRARAERALAMLGTADTIRATGGAAEIGGIRMERCDEYGRTETTEANDRLRAELEHEQRWRARLASERGDALEALESARHRLSILERDAGHLKDERDAATDAADSLLKKLETARRERDVALAGAESADVAVALLACGARTVHDGVWRDCARSVGHPGPHVATPLERVEW